MTRNFLLADYKEATDGLGITKAIYMEVAVVPDQKLAEAEHIIKVCEDKSNPTCAAVICRAPTSRSPTSRAAT